MDLDRRERQGRRIGLDSRARLITSDGLAIDVRLADLSSEGFRIEHGGEDLIVGEAVTLATLRTEAKAEIRWATASEAGGVFLDPPPELG